ncbi:MAG: hypothetical protein OP8BY_0030 [Candidatus Saccharicenans subterraneus]|uniref:Uncharacterized protein n=1 Tax=Candidatus Saccharicenans subterraneus TaxID=2508984 RepID=A0A3E2BLM6_9BACT|nr:MAG: hypothetical protein OP8BY_0030 [Candidatus Saccharicenans subterraneum]
MTELVLEESTRSLLDDSNIIPGSPMPYFQVSSGCLIRL